MAFDPDAFLSESTPPPTSAPAEQSGFNPDAFLASDLASEEKPLPATDMLTGMVKNAPGSAVQFGKDLVHPFIHPVETAEAVKNIGHGLLQKAGVVSGEDKIAYPDEVGKFFVDRYGSMDKFARTLSADPVGVAADLSAIFSGGGTLAARTPGILGRAGHAVSEVGRAVDPINAATQAAKTVGHGVAGVVGELGTHSGYESLITAARAGHEGGDAAKYFHENQSGLAPLEDTVVAAQQGIDNMRRARGDEYRAKMAALGADKTVLDFSKIDDAITNVENVSKYKGQELRPNAEATRDAMKTEIENWKDLDPAEFHTAEGLDALKQKLGDIRDNTQYGTPARKIANEIYSGVRRTIVAQAPEYAKTMKGYELASKQIKEIERALSVNERASVDTGLRKLQAVLRNNVSSAYGHRRQLAEFLINNGSPHLMERLAGQATSSWAPRGLGKLALIVGGEMAGIMLGMGHGLPTAVATVGATLPLTSPRLMGEAAYYGGQAGRLAGKYIDRGTAQRAYQIGRGSSIDKNRIDSENAMRRTRALAGGQ